jgi:hypothetical protein
MAAVEILLPRIPLFLPLGLDTDDDDDDDDDDDNDDDDEGAGDHVDLSVCPAFILSMSTALASADSMTIVMLGMGEVKSASLSGGCGV